jgi:RimJ/RimL family protein N-acetyltransferase
VDVLLETERLLLRRFTPADVDHLFDLDSDPDVMRYLNGGTPTPRDAVEHDILPRMIRSYEGGAGIGYWATIERATGDFLGWINLRRGVRGDGEEAEMGYRLRKAAWGHGYATEGARALLRLAFADPTLRRVFAITYQDNLASRRVMEKCGMAFVRSFRPTSAELQSQGSYEVTSAEPWDGDDVEYGVTREAWEQMQAGTAGG